MSDDLAPGFPPLSDDQRTRYLDRLGWTQSVAVDVATLRALGRRHLEVVPFENLDIHLGVPIELDPERIVTKVVDHRRGGLCFELNGAFARLLLSIGFDVRMMEARVYEAVNEPHPFGHLALRVQLDETYLADVGFGRAFDEAIRLDDRDDQRDTGGTFRLVDARDGELDLLANGTPVYQLAPSPTRAFDEFADACRWHQTSADSIFTQGTVCTRRTEHGRVTLAGTTLIETVDGVRAEVVIDDVEEIRATYAARFGIELSLDDVDALVNARRRPGFANW
jgi:N-hydroxyarylamine O-acetyltransferase